MSSLSFFNYRVLYSHSLPNAYDWRTRAADHDFLHRVAAKEKRPQKIHWYSLPVCFSPAMHRKYLLTPMQITRLKLKCKEVKDKESNGGYVDNVVLLLIRGCFCIKTLTENYHHCTRSQHGISTLLSRRLVCFPPLIFSSHITGFCFLREPKLSCHIFWA